MRNLYLRIFLSFWVAMALVLSFTVTDSHGKYINGLKPTDFRIFEDGIVQSDGKDAEAERLRTLEQLVRGIIDHILRVIQGVDVKIDLDPIIGIICAHVLARLPRHSFSVGRCSCSISDSNFWIEVFSMRRISSNR